MMNMMNQMCRPWRLFRPITSLIEFTAGRGAAVDFVARDALQLLVVIYMEPLLGQR